MIEDNALFENFVTPPLCRLLVNAGLTTASNFTWKIVNHQLQLQANCFDPDGYYRDAVNMVDDINNPIILPAYGLKEVEKCLPFYRLESVAGGYTLFFDAFTYTCKHGRLPDVFALAVLGLAEKNIVNIPIANTILKKASAKFWLSAQR